jgi:hypothetical protein
MTAERGNPFSDLTGGASLADEFKPKPRTEKRAPIDPEVIEKISEDQGFPSRGRTGQKKITKAPARERQRRNATGRNQQINIKTTAEAIALLYELADRKRVPLGKVLEDGLEALKKAGY